MKLILTIAFALLVLAVPVFAVNHYGWTISSSLSDAFANTGGIVPGGLAHLYLWYQCSDQGGMSAADFGIAAVGGIAYAGFTPLNGFLNAGNQTNLLLAVGGCPTGPVVAGDLTIIWFASAANVCIVPSNTGLRVTVDCVAPAPSAWPLTAVGWDALGPPNCVENLCTNVHCWCWYCDTTWGLGCIFAPNFPCPCPNGPEVCDNCDAVAVDPTTWGRTKSLYR